ncbi:MAG TPA: helix-turn-helix domain-containing protein [Dehalococcoidia bacterium]|jgi:excisionase family DNA binding protein|nr:helix-turn-helix domain-containing protein [Dehalococcoidia bacterium]
MNVDPFPEYLTIEQAAAYLSVSPGQVRRLLREFGMGEFVRAQIGKEVTIRKRDLEALAASLPSRPPSRGRRQGKIA